MPQSSKTSHHFGSIEVANITNINNFRMNRSTVSQGTSITTGVTINAPAGFIFTFTSGSIATAGNTTFNVANSAVRSDSVVLGNIVDGGITGMPIMNINSITQGSFDVVLKNADLTNPIDGSLKLSYSIL